MSTEALAETCLNYPLYPEIVAYNNSQDGFNRLATNFNGFSELLSRVDAGIILIKKYKSMNPANYSKEWPVEKQGHLVFEFLFIEMLLAQEGVVHNLSINQKKELAKECLKKFESKTNEKDLFGLVGLDHTSYTMLKIINSDVTIKEQLIQDRKIKQFSDTGNASELETLLKIKDLTVAYVNRK